MIPFCRTRISCFAGLAAFMLCVPMGQPLYGAELPEMDEEIQLVVAALVMRMRGVPHDTLPEFVYDGRSMHTILEPEFTYQGFDLVQLLLSEKNPDIDGQGTARLAGDLLFADAMGRHAFALFRVDYVIEDRVPRLVIRDAIVAPRSPYQPRLQAFIVPAEKLRGRAWRAARKNHADVYRFIQENSLALDQPDTLPRGLRKYVMVFFFFDRLPDDPELYVEPFDIPTSGRRVTPPSVENLEFRNWRVPLVTVTADLHADPPGGLSMMYSPAAAGTEVEGSPLIEPYEIARFHFAPADRQPDNASNVIPKDTDSR